MRLKQSGTARGVTTTTTTTTKDSVNELTKAGAASQQQLRDLYDAEARLRHSFTARLDRATERATKSPILYVYLNDFIIIT